MAQHLLFPETNLIGKCRERAQDPRSTGMSSGSGQDVEQRVLCTFPTLAFMSCVHNKVWAEVRMSDSDCDYMDLIEQYVDRFGDGPDIFEMDDEAAVAALKQALESGVPVPSDDND